MKNLMPHSVFFSLVMLLSYPLFAASFDCDKAKTTLEHTICEHKPLNKLDGEMGELYRNLLKKLGKSDAELLKQAQRHWLETRTNGCNEKNLECLMKIYQERISTLEFRGSTEYSSSPAAKISGLYIEEGMNMMVDALSEKTVMVMIQGGDPEVGKWTCDFSETGTLTGNIVKLKSLDDNAVVSVTFKNGVAEVDEGAAISVWCGSGGMLSGTYKRHR